MRPMPQVILVTVGLAKDSCKMVTWEVLEVAMGAVVDAQDMDTIQP